MLLEHVRRKTHIDSTISDLYLRNGGRLYWICLLLEDGYRTIKVPGESRIPAKEYQLRLRQYGSHHRRYKNRFADIHNGMIEINNVPGFTDILIHCGNFVKDTAGCLIPGMTSTGGYSGKGSFVVYDSETAYRRLYHTIIDTLLRGEPVTWRINELEQNFNYKSYEKRK